jgi:mono/diheme cytochrome c family protein
MSVVMKGHMRQSLAAGAALSLLVWAGPTLAAGDVTNGQALSEKWCGSCHFISEAAAEGMEGEAAPSFMEMKVSNPSELQAKLAQPHPFMPSFKDFTDQDYEDIFAYLDTVEDK